MAQTTKSTTTNQNIGSTQGGISGIGSPISNEAYNVISALHAKLEGLEAYRKYAHDGHEEIWKNLCSQEVQGVRVLIDELERIVRDGQLRMNEPGRGKA
jgi:hypothetical protein